ncbi:mitochondrial ribosomal protein L21 [Oratosquilla oratoria]|uniref:mitochondrial ribosomal protein L21 n=1 Tax=Oratosquilla oratoria TaxID=337810 RepID=UPI003F768B9C
MAVNILSRLPKTLPQNFKRVLTTVIDPNKTKQERLFLPLMDQIAGLRTLPPQSSTAPVIVKEQQQPSGDLTENIKQGVLSNVNNQIRNSTHGRLFAVIHVAGKQHKVTPEDLVVIQGRWPPSLGDKLRLEKILAVGGKDFTIFGQPLLHRDLVNVEATVIEKNLSHTKLHFRNRRRKNSRSLRFIRTPLTTLRINCVDILHPIDELPELEGAEGRIL